MRQVFNLSTACVLVSCQFLVGASITTAPGEVRDYLHRHLPGHKIFYGFMFDFNGDSKSDWIGYLESEETDYPSLDGVVDLYCICTSKRTFEHIMLKQRAGLPGEDNIHSTLRRVKRGLLTSRLNDQVDISLAHDGIEWSGRQNVRIVFYWNGSEVQKFWTAD